MNDIKICTTGNKDKLNPNTLEKGTTTKSSVKENTMSKSDSKRKKNVPKAVIIVTADEAKSREIVAKAMAEMYKRMLNPM